MHPLQEINPNGYGLGLYEVIVAEMIREYLRSNKNALDRVIRPAVIKPDFTGDDLPTLLASDIDGEALADLIDKAANKMKGQLKRWRTTEDKSGVTVTIAESLEEMPINGTEFVQTKIDENFLAFLTDCYRVLRFNRPSGQ